MNSDSKDSTFPTSSSTSGGKSSSGLGSTGGSSSSGLSGSTSGLSSSGSGSSGSMSGISGGGSSSSMSGGSGSSGSGMSGSGSMSGGGSGMTSGSSSMNSDGTVKKAAQVAHQYVDKLEQTLGSSGSKVMSMQQEYGEAAREQVKASPLAAVGIAFAVGIVFSKLFMR